MALIPSNFEWGESIQELPDEFSTSLQDAYQKLSRNLNLKDEFVVKDRAPGGTPDANGSIPSTTDVDYSLGTSWIYKDASSSPKVDNVYKLTDKFYSSGTLTAQWTKLN